MSIKSSNRSDGAHSKNSPAPTARRSTNSDVSDLWVHKLTVGHCEIQQLSRAALAEHKDHPRYRLLKNGEVVGHFANREEMQHALEQIMHDPAGASDRRSNGELLRHLESSREDFCDDSARPPAGTGAARRSTSLQANGPGGAEARGRSSPPCHPQSAGHPRPTHPSSAARRPVSPQARRGDSGRRSVEDPSMASEPGSDSETEGHGSLRAQSSTLTMTSEVGTTSELTSRQSSSHGKVDISRWYPEASRSGGADSGRPARPLAAARPAAVDVSAASDDESSTSPRAGPRSPQLASSASISPKASARDRERTDGRHHQSSGKAHSPAKASDHPPLPSRSTGSDGKLHSPPAVPRKDSADPARRLHSPTDSMRKASSSERGPSPRASSLSRSGSTSEKSGSPSNLRKGSSASSPSQSGARKASLVRREEDKAPSPTAAMRKASASSPQGLRKGSVSSPQGMRKASGHSPSLMGRKDSSASPNKGPASSPSNSARKASAHSPAHGPGRSPDGVRKPSVDGRAHSPAEPGPRLAPRDGRGASSPHLQRPAPDEGRTRSSSMTRKADSASPSAPQSSPRLRRQGSSSSPRDAPPPAPARASPRPGPHSPRPAPTAGGSGNSLSATAHQGSPVGEASPRVGPTQEPDKRSAKLRPPSPPDPRPAAAAPEVGSPEPKGPQLTPTQKPAAEKERVVAWYYDDPSNTWTYKELEVRLAPEFFSQGGMRQAFMMLICEPDGTEKQYVAKLYNSYAETEIIAPDESMFGGENPERLVGKNWAMRTLRRQPGCEFEAMLMQICTPDGTMFSLRDFLTWHRRLKLFKIDVEMQGFCQTYAAEFNKRHPPKPVVFLDAFLIVCVNRPSQPIFACEPMIKGEFIKHNNNCGVVQERSMERNTPQAFSHFTYWFSRNQYIIVDIQGVNDTYTDPQVHSVDRQGFGMGNLGQEGIDCFFRTHRCNNICTGLGLVPPNKKADEAGTHFQGLIPPK